MSVDPVIRKVFSTPEISPNTRTTANQPERFKQQLRINMVGCLDADSLDIIMECRRKKGLPLMTFAGHFGAILL